MAYSSHIGRYTLTTYKRTILPLKALWPVGLVVYYVGHETTVSIYMSIFELGDNANA